MEIGERILQNQWETTAQLPGAFQYSGNTYVNLRTEPSTKTGKVFGKVCAGEQVILLSIRDGWAELIKHQEQPMLRGYSISLYFTSLEAKGYNS